MFGFRSSAPSLDIDMSSGWLCTSLGPVGFGSRQRARIRSSSLDESPSVDDEWTSVRTAHLVGCCDFLFLTPLLCTEAEPWFTERWW